MIEPPDVTVSAVLERHGVALAGRTAVVDGTRRLTYASLEDRVARLAASLWVRGVRFGDRIAWIGRNSSRLFELMLASSRLGAMTCPVNWRQSVPELSFVLDDLQPRVVVWEGADLGRRTSEVRAAHPEVVSIDSDDRDDDGYERLLRDAPPARTAGDVQPEDPFLIVYTGAHDGRPAGVLLNSRALLCQAVLLRELYAMDVDYTYLVAGPMFHLGTLWQMIATFWSGGKNVFLPQADRADMLRLIETERCNDTYLTDLLAAELAELNQEMKYDVSSIRRASSVAAWAAMTGEPRAPGARWPQGYGQTELAGHATVQALTRDDRPLTGHPSPWLDVRLVDEGGTEVPDGSLGEIVVRGPTVTNGYWRRPGLNARRFRDGWYHTGDLGRRETDGAIAFVAPKLRVVKSGMENVYPAEVEECLRSHPQVVDAAVIGVPDERWVQAVRALVVVATGSTVTGEQLIEHCRSRIASYKKPRDVVFVSAIPRTNGVIDYDALDDAHQGGGYPGVGPKGRGAAR